MHKAKPTSLGLLSVLLISATVFAQDGSRGKPAAGASDVATLKRKAEAGDVSAQVALGDALSSKSRASEALEWYRKAATNGDAAAAYHVGEMLLFGSPGTPPALTVQPNPSEGIRWTFQAATNLYPHACWNMAKALRQGLGTSTNLVEAYAWLKVFAEVPPGSAAGRLEMSELAPKLDTNSLARAEALVAQFKAGKWRAPGERELVQGDDRLKLTGISLGAPSRFAMINGKTFAEGESGSVPVTDGRLTITCLKIEKNSVTVKIDGEDALRVLR